MNTFPSHARQVRTSAVFRRLRSSLHDRLAACYASILPGALLRRALDEAAETAHSTDFPLLFLPALAEERVRAVASVIAPNRTPCQSAW